MTFKDGFLKKVGTVVTNATSDILGDEAAEKLSDVSKNIYDKAEELGVNNGIRKAAQIGNAGLGLGKNKIAEWSGKSDTKYAADQQNMDFQNVLENMPNAVILNAPIQEESNPSVQRESTYQKYCNQADKIWKMKELLDLGVITLEEFEKKKKQILEL